MFENKTVVITGVGDGIGRGLAAGFYRDGANVVGAGRTEATLRETAALHGGERMRIVLGDVSRDADARRLVDEAEREFGGVDILVNNAAVHPKQPFLESGFDDWAEAIEINVVAMARLCHLVLPGMLERGHGRIINLGSWAWRAPIPRASAYSTAKGAVSALTRALACEIDRTRHPNVLINELIPGIYRTRMTPDQGDDPMTAYEHARHVASLPSGGPNGEIFERSKLYVDHPRSRLNRLVKRLMGWA